MKRMVSPISNVDLHSLDNYPPHPPTQIWESIMYLQIHKEKSSLKICSRRIKVFHVLKISVHSIKLTFSIQRDGDLICQYYLHLHGQYCIQY